MSYQLLQIRRERGHCYHPLHTLFSTGLWDLDVAGRSGRINNEVPKTKNRDSDVHFGFLEVWCSERMLLTLCMCCCAAHLALCLGALAWHLSWVSEIIFICTCSCRAVCVCVCACVCVRPHSWSLTLHTWLLRETSFSLAHLDVYSFIYGKPGNHRPCLGLLWQRGKAAQIYAWQQKLIRHQLTHANVYALNFF